MWTCIKVHIIILFTIFNDVNIIQFEVHIVCFSPNMYVDIHLLIGMVYSGSIVSFGTNMYAIIVVLVGCMNSVVKVDAIS